MTIQYIAVAFIGSVSVYGQAATIADAIRHGTRNLVDIGKAFGGFRKDADPIPFNVYDYRPWDSITWSDLTCYGHTIDPVTKERSEGVPLTPERFIFVNPITKAITRDVSYADWMAERAARDEGKVA